MNLNKKFIFLAILSLFLLLTSVCVFASDNATCSLNEIPDSSLDIPVPSDEPTHIENETPQKNIDKSEYPESDENHTSNTELNYQNEAVINHGNTGELTKANVFNLNTQSKCIFAGETITVDPIITSAIMNGETHDMIKDDLFYSAIYDKHTQQFILCFTKEFDGGITYEKIYQFKNFGNAYEIVTMLETEQYVPVITLTKNYDINSQEDYMTAVASNADEMFSPLNGNSIYNEIENERKRCELSKTEYTFNK